MTKHIPSAVIMVRPSNFGFNAETAVNNAFQNTMEELTPSKIQENALKEFNHMVDTLRFEGIEVVVFDDLDNDTPDSVFPNNWFTTFTEEVMLYPIFSENRRKERKEHIYNEVSSRTGKPINSTLLAFEQDGDVLEGTGSLVCDHKSKTAFAAMSARTSHVCLDQFEKETGYSTVRFETIGPDENAIYHTNVMMTMADDFAIIGVDCIHPKDKERVLNELKSRGKEIIALTNDQVFSHFAGNMLQLQNGDEQKFMVMSLNAYKSLDDQQLEKIEQFNNEIIAPSINTIETVGGGSARCMIAELFENED